MYVDPVESVIAKAAVCIAVSASAEFFGVNRCEQCFCLRHMIKALLGSLFSGLLRHTFMRGCHRCGESILGHRWKGSGEKWLWAL